MNSTTIASRVGGAEMAVDIASISSRVFCLMRNAVAAAAAGLQLPGVAFKRFAHAATVRARSDRGPPLQVPPQGVMVGSVGLGQAESRHATTDVPVRVGRQPRNVMFYPASAIRRAVATRSRAEFEVVPVSLREANEIVEGLHRRLGAVQGHKIAVGLRRSADERFVGAAVCSRPVGGHLDDGLTAEVRRVAVDPAVRDGRRKLLGAIAKAASGMGYRRLVLESTEVELSTSLAAAGWDLMIGRSVGGRQTSASRRRQRGADERAKQVWCKILRGEERMR